MVRKPKIKDAAKKKTKKPELEILQVGICTKEITDSFCEYLREGLAADACCDMIGINPATFHRWLRLGEEYLNTEEESRVKEHKLFAYFAQKFRQAVANYKLDRVRKLHNGSGRRWYRELMILERRDRGNYGRYEQHGGSTDAHNPDDRFL